MSDANDPQRISGHVAVPPSYSIGAYLRSANQREEEIIENLVRQDAVPQGECILVFGDRFGSFQKTTPVSYHFIWMYNLYTEQWRKHIIPESELCPPNTAYACAVAIKEDAFIFGGINESQRTYSNELWKLSKSSAGLFTWSKVRSNNKKVPSPRNRHSGWTYSGKLFVFGGFGPSVDGYLNHNGEYLQYRNGAGHKN